MKILQINKLYYPHLGGIETIVKDIAEGLSGKDDLSVDVLACQNKGRRKIETINGITVYRSASLGIKMGMPISLDFFRLFFKIYKNYDAIIIHHPFPLAFLALPFIKNKPVFIWYHSDIVRQKISGFLFSPLLYWGLKKARLIFSASQNLINKSAHLKLWQDKCRLIRFGLDLKYFQQDTAPVDIKSPGPLILAVGRLVYYKGFKYLIEAMDRKEIKSIPDIKLIVIGSGPLKNELEKQIKDLDLENIISIINPVSDLRPYYRRSDLFIMPSIANSEAFGLVQMEALACGLPVINTNLPTGVPEVSIHNISGLTVPPANAEALAEAIAKIINDSALKEQFSQQATERARELFDKERFISELEKTLKNLK